MRSTAPSPRRCRLTLLLALVLLSQIAAAQPYVLSIPVLPRSRYRSGRETLHAFAPVSEATRYSIVKFYGDLGPAALGTVVDTNGLTLTKASELRQNSVDTNGLTLTNASEVKHDRIKCWLACGREAEAELVAVDEEEDLALVRVHASGLKPIQWATDEPALGQWAITPGIEENPHAVGIISALSRKIRPQRAYIGVRFGVNSETSAIESVTPDLGAAKAGLKAGDIIVAVNSVTMTNRQQVVDTLSDFREGQTVTLRIQRAEESFDAEVRLMEPSADDIRSGYFPPQGVGRLAGPVSSRARGFEEAIEHDTVLQPWLCGGPLVNLEGKAIGLNIARAERVTTYALPAKLVQRVLEDLKAKPVRTTPTSTPSPKSGPG
jgi:serine protease Do